MQSTTSRKGFTVIELLVAVGVTALLVTLMINIVTTVLTNWNRTSGSLSSGNQARLVMDQISQDLQGAILKLDGNVWLAASVQTGAPVTGVPNQDWANANAKPNDATSLQLAPVGLSFEDYRFGLAGVWLRMITVPSGENRPNDLSTISAPRAVSYQIVRKRVGGASSTQFSYQLFRAEVSPDQTFTQGYDFFEPDGYNLANSANRGDIQNIRSPLDDQVIASGIVDFGVRFFAPDSASGNIVEIFPVDRRSTSSPLNAQRNAFAATTNTTISDPGTGLANANVTRGFPTVAEVMIRVLTPEGSRLLEAKESGQNVPGNWWDIVEQNSNVYTRRIDIKSTAL